MKIPSELLLLAKDPLMGPALTRLIADAEASVSYAEQFRWHTEPPPAHGDYFVKTSLDVYQVAWYQPQLGWDGDLRGTAEGPEVVTGWMHIPGEGHPAYDNAALSKKSSDGVKADDVPVAHVRAVLQRLMEVFAPDGPDDNRQARGTIQHMLNNLPGGIVSEILAHAQPQPTMTELLGVGNAEPKWRRKLLAAYTGTDSPYPGYINASYHEGGMVQVTVRGPHREDGSEGPCAMLEMNQWHFFDWFNTAKAALARDDGKWPCRRCGAPVHPDDSCPCPRAVHSQYLNTSRAFICPAVPALCAVARLTRPAPVRSRGQREARMGHPKTGRDRPQVVRGKTRVGEKDQPLRGYQHCPVWRDGHHRWHFLTGYCWCGADVWTSGSC